MAIGNFVIIYVQSLHLSWSSMQAIEYLNNLYSVYADSVDSFSHLISTPQVVNWQQRISFSGMVL